MESSVPNSNPQIKSPPTSPKPQPKQYDYVESVFLDRIKKILIDADSLSPERAKRYILKFTNKFTAQTYSTISNAIAYPFYNALEGPNSINYLKLASQLLIINENFRKCILIHLNYMYSEAFKFYLKLKMTNKIEELKIMRKMWYHVLDYEYLYAMKEEISKNMTENVDFLKAPSVKFIRSFYLSQGYSFEEINTHVFPKKPWEKRAGTMKLKLQANSPSQKKQEEKQSPKQLKSEVKSEDELAKIKKQKKLAFMKKFMDSQKAKNALKETKTEKPQIQTENEVKSTFLQTQLSEKQDEFNLDFDEVIQTCMYPPPSSSIQNEKFSTVSNNNQKTIKYVNPKVALMKCSCCKRTIRFPVFPNCEANVEYKIKKYNFINGRLIRNPTIRFLQHQPKYEKDEATNQFIHVACKRSQKN